MGLRYRPGSEGGGPRPAVAVGPRSGLVPGPWAVWQGSGHCGPPLTRPRGRAGDELELIRPSLYRNVARQLNVSPHSETAVTSAFLAVAAQIFSAGGPACAPPGARRARPRAVGWCWGCGASLGSEDAGPGGPPAPDLVWFFSALAGSTGTWIPGRAAWPAASWCWLLAAVGPGCPARGPWRSALHQLPRGHAQRCQAP